MIRLNKINKYYQSGNESIHAIKDLSITFPDKGLVFILGQSGCGKSTLLNMLGGLDKPDSGEILIEERNLNEFSKAELNDYLNSYLGFVFQEYNILKDLNLYENISLPLEMQNLPRKVVKKAVNEILEKVGLTELSKRKINQLSGGQRQRIAVARALIKNPKLIIADEPTGNLDSTTGETIFNLLKELSQDRLIIIVSHDEESAYKFGDRVIHINDGALERDSNPNFCTTLNNQLELKKARVPLKTSLKLSLKNVWKKKFRFMIMTLICALSLAFLSFTLELRGDKLRQNIYTSIVNDNNYVDILAKTNLPDDYIKTSFYDDYIGNSLPLDSYQKIKDSNPNLTVHHYQTADIDIVGLDDERGDNYYKGTIEYIVKYDSTNDYNLLAGRLPIVGNREILVTDYLTAMFDYFNMYDSDGTASDYIGKYLRLASGHEYKIVGVLKTSYLKWTDFSKSKTIDASYKVNYPYFNDYKMMNAIYLLEDDFNLERKANIPTLVKLNNYYANTNVTITPRPNWDGTPSTDKVVTTAINDYVLTKDKANLIKLQLQGWGSSSVSIRDAGLQPVNDDEIVIPLELAKELFPDYVLDVASANNLNNTFRYRIRNAELTLEIVNQATNESVKNTYRIVGLTEVNSTINMSENGLRKIYDHFNDQTEFLLAELPANEETAYSLFKTAYRNGYILDVWDYKNDIDTYTIDPFVDLLSKVGLFVFAIFSIGILWTIITLEIVDSKKEIGIFRSIGLSGFKVSLIFIIQTVFICIFSYAIALIVGKYALTVFNSTVMDELNLIHLSMYMMTATSPIALILFLVVIIAAALFFPLYKIMSQKIIDVISERDAL